MAASLGFGAASAALAEPGGMGPGMMPGMGPMGDHMGGPMAGPMATDKGSIVTQTSDDPAVVAALQAHALEVSELARDGMAAMMRGARARMGQ